MALLSYFVYALLLLASEISLGLDIVDISKYIREGFHAIELTNKDLLTSLY